jgi:DNA-binding transcriptional ArsR family regulator/catechol 2,3-dioxygenase-like lactoylglutathione lyase family enzyme
MASKVEHQTVCCHISLNVADLARSVAFYRVFFDRSPAKEHADYAKFEIGEPPLVLSLLPGRQRSGDALNHLGLRLPNAAALADIQRRLETEGMPTDREDGVACCHSRQTKFWISDPDRNLWEIYILENEDAVAPVRKTRGVSTDETGPTVWEHRLGEPLPKVLAVQDRTLEEVRLLGTLNAELTPAEQMALLREVRRALRVGGRLWMRMLVADKPLASDLLPLAGPAAVIERVPAANEIAEALLSAGFAALHWEKLSEAPHFRQDGIGMRELRLLAFKPEERPLAGRQTVVYRGPFAKVTDDAGNTYERGEQVLVSGLVAKNLRQGPQASHFIFLSGTDSAAVTAPAAFQGANAEPSQSDYCARVLRALAEPERLRLVRSLRLGPKNVTELAEALGEQIANVSHHLGVLRQAGVVVDEKQGRFVLYRLHPDVLQGAAGLQERDLLDFGCCRLELPTG